MGQREFGFSNNRRQHSPRSLQFQLSDAQRDRGLLPLYFRLKNVGTIGLADIGQLHGSLDRIASQFNEILPDREESLHCENLIEDGTNVVENANPLCLSANFDLLRPQLSHSLSRAELASEYDSLADEGALFAASRVAATNFVAVVTDRRVWIQPCLSGEARRGAKVRLNLR